MSKLTVSIELETQEEIDAMHRLCEMGVFSLKGLTRPYSEANRKAILFGERVIVLLEPMVTTGKEGGEDDGR